MNKNISILTLLILVIALISGCSAISKLFGGGDRATPVAASNENFNTLSNVSTNNTKKSNSSLFVQTNKSLNPKNNTNLNLSQNNTISNTSILNNNSIISNNNTNLSSLNNSGVVSNNNTNTTI